MSSTLPPSHQELEVPAPRPWMAYNRDGWLLCLMCPMSDSDKYRGVNTRRKRTRQIRAWVRVHEWCGFDGLD